MKTSLIDADSIVYIVAYKFKDFQEIAIDEVKRTCDTFVQAILQTTQATQYVGSFSDSPTFRHSLYKMAPYKGQRKEKEESFLYWENTIKSHLAEQWGFFTPLNIEADDVVSALSFELEGDWIICSPDKDMQQIKGNHFNYKKPDKGILYVSEFQAYSNFWKQVITGDSTDNIKGIPGLGEVKVEAIFKDMAEYHEDAFKAKTQEVYYKHFGSYYGEIILNETVNTVKLLGPTHSHWDEFKGQIDSIKEAYVRKVPEQNNGLDSTFLSQLGW